MLVLVLGLVVFFGVHLVRMVAPGLRAAQVAKGERRWKGLYALASLVGFGLIIWGWIIYRPDAPQIYDPPEWGRHLTMLLVLLAFIGVVAAYQPAGRIKATLQHPFIVGIMLWSAGHLLANGDLAGILVFGSFLFYSIWNLVSETQRDQPRAVFGGYRGDVVAVIVGLVAYALFVLWLHAFLFGVSPLG